MADVVDPMVRRCLAAALLALGQGNAKTTDEIIQALRIIYGDHVLNEATRLAEHESG